MLTRLRLLTAGESHGPRLTAILEGIPTGLAVDRSRIDEDLARRQRGPGSSGRREIERDTVRITAGVVSGLTTGGPIALEIRNRDHESWRGRDVDPMVTPRPGHADLTAAIKYGYSDLRPGLERASARETAMRVAAGGICRQLLGAFGIEVGGYAVRVGEVRVSLAADADPRIIRERFLTACGNDLACPDEGAIDALRAAITDATASGDTLGGLVEVVVLGVPPGLGSHVHFDRRLDARLAMAMVSVQAIKGVEIGPAFGNASLRGSLVHDEIHLDGDAIRRTTNRAGGIEGGISNGEPIVVRAAMKPISTTREPLRSVDLHAGRAARPAYERSDVCAVPRVVVVLEAMAAITVADALLEKLGGDSMDEILPRHESLGRGRAGELELDARQWRMDYDD